MEEVNKLSASEEEAILNPQVRSMTDAMLQDIPQRDPVMWSSVDYSEPVRDAKWFKARCEQLGIHLPDNYFEIMALHDAGVRPKQYRSMLKKEKRKQLNRIVRGTRRLSF